ncbi:hypothetical protein JOF29_001156 [Kribbella aluminosa]|uniref:Type II toxin-antitoxin system Phd/YefM family antitoxin n=1 Tax=Kribbella aluminosa TaxID=416017 RepID=A0ABS4UEN2_9ACTN|nr:hypothetical protein [Kribbella aluminosa]MBP2350073.1 hypothetical protein [Kribbella aluminosa]
MSSWQSVAGLRSDLATVLAHFRNGKTQAIGFGDGVLQAVVVTYDEFAALDGPQKFSGGDVLTPKALAAQFDAVLAERTQPLVWGARGEPEAVVMSAAQYRGLRPDPTSLLPPTGPLDLADWAARMGPELQEVLEDLRCDREDV